jgi:DNA-binding MarR family transcriptional regulator
VGELNEIIHQPVRLRLVAALSVLDRGERIEFAALRRLLDLTDGNLGAHLQKLEVAGYVRVQKAFVARKPRTFIALTARGRAAYEDHVEALRRIIDSDPPLPS